VSAQAHGLARELLTPPLLSVVAAPARWANELIAVGLLPPRLRQQYGFAWNADRERSLHQTLLLLRAARHAVPDVMARWPDARHRDRTRPPTWR
jgi:uncharacterized protein (DUF2236 family)